MKGFLDTFAGINHTVIGWFQVIHSMMRLNRFVGARIYKAMCTVTQLYISLLYVISLLHFCLARVCHRLIHLIKLNLVWTFIIKKVNMANHTAL